jgi:hypothetical protein
MHYNYSVSLIRKVDSDWIVYPEEPTLQAIYYELRTKTPGNSYLATKTQGDLSYCIFLCGEVCHTDVYGWIITLNGYQITKLKDRLWLFQEVWKLIAHSPTKVKHDLIHQWIYSCMEKFALIPRSNPIPIDRNKEDSYQIFPFEPPRPEPKMTLPKPTDNGGHLGPRLAASLALLSLLSLLLLLLLLNYPSLQEAYENIRKQNTEERAGRDDILSSYRSYEVPPPTRHTPPRSDRETSTQAATAERLFRDFMATLSQQDYMKALEYFDFPLTRYFSDRSLSRSALYEKLQGSDWESLQSMRILYAEHLSNGSTRITFLCDNPIQDYETYRIVCIVSVRDTPRGSKIYSINEVSQSREYRSEVEEEEVNGDGEETEQGQEQEY